MGEIAALLEQARSWRRFYRRMAEAERDDDKRLDFRILAEASRIRETALEDAMKALKRSRSGG